MVGKYERLREPGEVKPSTHSDTTRVIDLGPFSKFRVQFRVLKAGTAGEIFLEEAAINEEEAFKALNSTFTKLNGSDENFEANHIVSVNEFLRYVRWATTGDVAGTPMALIDLIAKE